MCWKALLCVAAACAVVRLCIGWTIWRYDLFITHDEDIARYWVAKNLFAIVPDGGDPARDYWFMEATPWLPLHLFLFNLLGRLGSIHLPAMLAFQNVLSWAATVLGSVLAWELAGRRREATWLAAGLLVVFPLMDRVGSGLMSEPLFFLSLMMMTLGALKIARSESGTLPPRIIFWSGVVIGQLTRYEAWTFSLLLILALGCVGNRRELALRFGAWALIPMGWMAFHWLTLGDPLQFLTLTMDQYALNVSALRSDRPLHALWTSLMTVPQLIAFAGCAAGIFLFRERDARFVAALSLALLGQTFYLTWQGAGAFSFLEHHTLAPFLLAAPVAGAAIVEAVRRIVRGWNRTVELTAAALFVGSAAYAVLYLTHEVSYQNERYSYRAIKNLTGDSTWIFVDGTRGDWNLPMLEMIAPGRWEVRPPSNLPLLGAGDFILLLRRENYRSGFQAARTGQWVIVSPPPSTSR